MTQSTEQERAHALAEKHGATSYRNRADTSNPAFGFTLGQLEALISEVEQAARRAPVVAVPQGWKLVPEVLTPEMKRECMDSLMDGIDIYMNSNEQIEIQTDAPRRIWKFLLAAAPQPPDAAQCWCQTCRPQTLDDMRFIVCPDCGNKRCPKANNHANACTNSNAPGQKGSSWENVKPVAAAPQPPEAAPVQMIESREVVSTGSGVTVTRLNLSEAGRAALQSKADHIPGAGQMVAAAESDKGIPISQQNQTVAAPVQLPEPWAISHHNRVQYSNAAWHGETPDGTKLYTDQQVRQLLAAHGIQEQST